MHISNKQSAYSIVTDDCILRVLDIFIMGCEP